MNELHVVWTKRKKFKLNCAGVIISQQNSGPICIIVFTLKWTQINRLAKQLQEKNEIQTKYFLVA